MIPNMQDPLRIKPDVLWRLAFLILCALAYWVQNNLYLHKDVAIITHTATQLLQGQTYAHDIFEPNPPIIFYLHWIPIIIAKISGLSILDTLRTYILILIGISMLHSHELLKTLLESAKQRISKNTLYLISCGIAYVLLFLPAESFGQREHFYIILTLPYLFLAACRLDAKPVSRFVAISIGCMAGIGFAIKPFFLPTLLLIGLLFVYQNRHVLGWLRLESILCVSILGLYGLTVFWIYPTYLSVVLPFWMPYYLGIVKPWAILIASPCFIWCCAALFLHLVRKAKPRSMLKHLIAISIFGNLITYLVPQVNWYYHLYPALAMTCLYFIFFFSELSSTLKHSNDILVSSLLAVIIFFIPANQSILRTLHAFNYFHTNNPEKQLMTLLNTFPDHNNYMFFSMTHNLYDLELYSSAKQVGSLSFCNWEYTRLGQYSPFYQNTTRAYALNIITQDLNIKKPEFVIIDVPSSQNYLGQKIDFSKEYDRDKGFHKTWSHYVFLTSIYPYDIYQRIVIRP